ncbi:MAG: flagellar motor protein [Bryobacterales bacterium]|nr:flagellar motor protein [Bryobacterales bacterium]
MPKKKTRVDAATAFGLLLAALGIVGGLILEGGQLSDITQVTAALIVFGGTIGAVMVTTPVSTLVRAAKQVKWVFLTEPSAVPSVIDELIGYANKARKQGLVSLEAEVDQITDPFLRKALSLAVDGTDLQDLRRMMELELVMEERQAEAAAKVYEAAGGYAPTIGIIGAVLGLIQVMKQLANIEAVGHGIAVAFVATVYGVGIANLFFLPAGAKLKARMHETSLVREVMLEGVISIVEGMNPKLIRTKLEAFLEDRGHAPAQQPSGAAPMTQTASVRS